MYSLRAPRRGAASEGEAMRTLVVATATATYLARIWSGPVMVSITGAFWVALWLAVDK